MGTLPIDQKLWLSIASVTTVGIVIYLIAKKIETKWFFETKEGYENTIASTSILHSNYEEEESETEHEESDIELEPYAGPSIGSEYVEGFQEGMEDPGKTLENIGKFFKALATLAQRFGRFIYSFIEFGQGALMLLLNIAQMAVITAEDVFMLAIDSFACFITFITNFRQCIVFWVIDWVGSLMKSLFFTFPMFIIYVLTGVDLQPMVDILIEEVINPLDDVIFSIMGYHFIHFPDWVIKVCYTCNLMRDLYKIGDDFSGQGRVGKLFMQPVSLFIQGGQDFIQLFDPL